MARAALQPFRERAIGGRGLGVPDGCWCARINAEALRAKARWTTTRGYTGGLVDRALEQRSKGQHTVLDCP